MHRRHFFSAMGGAVGAAVLGSVTACTGRTTPVTLMAAGSLNHAFEYGLTASVPERPLEIEAHGSVTAARLVAEGKRDPDIVSLADAALFDGPLHPDGYVAFATNALVLAYLSETPVGRRLDDAGPADWYEPLLEGDLRIGRTDPDLDPLGYRTLFALDLATRYHDVPGLSDRLLRPNQIFPETALVSQFESGAIDVAFTYRSMATARGYAYVDLPPQINLGDPAHAQDWYDTVTHRLPDGKLVRGSPIRYVSALRHVRSDVMTVFDRQCRGAYLEEHGFSVPDHYPHVHGNVHESVAAMV